MNSINIFFSETIEDDIFLNFDRNRVHRGEREREGARPKNPIQETLLFTRKSQWIYIGR